MSMELLLETALYFLRAFASCNGLLFLFLFALNLQLKVAASLFLFLSSLLLFLSSLFIPLFSLPHVALPLLPRDRLRLGLGHSAFLVVAEPAHAVGAVAGVDGQDPASVPVVILRLDIDVGARDLEVLPADPLAERGVGVALLLLLPGCWWR